MPPKQERVTYIDKDVYQEAKNRIRFVIGHYDHIFVSFSGGKDSLVVLELVLELYEELGITDKVNVVFRDEELIPDDVIDMVLAYYHDPRINMRYYAVPMKSRMFILGDTIPYVQWDPSREWIRQKPDIAITQLHPENIPLVQHEMNPLIYKGMKGSIAVLNGIRASESLMRFNSCMAIKSKYNWINKDAAKNVVFCKPIFDWSEVDVFKYFFDRKVKYCDIYDKEMWAKAPLRVSTPLHAQAFSYLTRMREMYPTFFQQICQVFPEVLAHEKYWKDYDQFAVIAQYPKSFEGIELYIDENIDDPKARKIAKSALIQAQQQKDSNMRGGRYPNACSGYPLLYVFKKIIQGGYAYGIPPIDTANTSMLEFEAEALEEVMYAETGR